MGTGDAKLRRIIDIASEAQTVNGCAGRTVIELPSGFAERFKRETASAGASPRDMLRARCAAALRSAGRALSAPPHHNILHFLQQPRETSEVRTVD